MISSASPPGIHPNHDTAILPDPAHGPGPEQAAGHHELGQAPSDLRACSACPHAADAHDGLGIRFCAATTAAGRPRGCICSAGTPRLR